MSGAQLETARLAFRVPTLADFEDSLRLWRDPDVVRFIGNRPFTREETWARMMRHVGHWQLLGYGFWTVRDRSDGAFVGEVGFGNFRREMEPALGDVPEIGWVLSPAWHSRGIATEAAGAALDWIERRHAPERTVCVIESGNAASLRVAAKQGYEEFARTTYKDAAVILLERMRGGRDADLWS